MTFLPLPRGRWSLSLTGKFAQFNLSLLLIFVALVVLFVLSLRSTIPIISHVASFLIILLIIGCVCFVLWYYSRQESRPNGQAAVIQVEDAKGRKVLISNPPDRFFAKDQTNALIRSLLLGYDEDLTPDGQVIGKVSDQKYRMYSPEEQKQFKEKHRALIRGKKKQAILLLQRAEQEQEPTNQPVQDTAETTPRHPSDN
jgi:hypothetical protein